MKILYIYIYLFIYIYLYIYIYLLFNWYALINEGKIKAAFENIKYQIKTKKKRDKNPNFIYYQIIAIKIVF